MPVFTAFRLRACLIFPFVLILSGCSGGGDAPVQTPPAETSRSLLEQIVTNCTLYTGNPLSMMPKGGSVIAVNSKEITGIHCSNLNIQDLTIFKPFENLAYLGVKKANLTQLSGLENLRNLQELDVSDNQITQTRSLALASQLKKVNLGKNPLQDYQGLLSLPQITHIGLEETRADQKITQLHGFSTRSSLREIRLAQNSQIACSQVDTLRAQLKSTLIQAPAHCAHTVTFNPKMATRDLVIDNTQPGNKRVARVALQVEHTLPIDHIKILISGFDLIIIIHEPVIEIIKNPLDILTEMIQQVPVTIAQHHIIVKNWQANLQAQIDSIAIPNPKDGGFWELTLSQISQTALASVTPLTALPALTALSTGGKNCELQNFPLPECRLIAFNLFAEACPITFDELLSVQAEADDAVVFGPTVTIADLAVTLKGLDLEVLVKGKDILTLTNYQIPNIPNAVIIEGKAYPAASFFASLASGLIPGIDPEAVAEDAAVATATTALNTANLAAIEARRIANEAKIAATAAVGTIAEAQKAQEAIAAETNAVTAATNTLNLVLTATTAISVAREPTALELAAATALLKCTVTPVVPPLVVPPTIP